MQLRQLTDIQRLILATLGEAGEEHLSALINTVIVVHGHREEINTASDALIGLLRAGLIAVADSNHSTSLEWIPMKANDAFAHLENITGILMWSDRKNLWAASKGSPSLEVILTDEGKAMSHQVLLEEGVPDPNRKITIT